jgi:hypothetical protein
VGAAAAGAADGAAAAVAPPNRKVGAAEGAAVPPKLKAGAGWLAGCCWLAEVNDGAADCVACCPNWKSPPPPAAAGVDPILMLHV